MHTFHSNKIFCFILLNGQVHHLPLDFLLFTDSDGTEFLKDNEA